MNVHPKKLLWPTDFSTLALKGAEYARALRDQFNAELHVVTVCNAANTMIPGLPIPPDMHLAVTREDLQGIVAPKLRQVVEAEFGSRVRTPSEVLIGTPWAEICSYARRNEIDLIIVATHGRTGLRHVVIGSVAERLVQHAPCPVLTVKNADRDFTVP